MTARPLPASAFALLAAASALFTVYGSLVPFHFHSRPLADAVARFRLQAVGDLTLISKSDFVANVLLGVPLGFGLIAALRVDRPRSPAKTALTALLVWPLTALFAAFVEFAQLFFPGRTCAGSDILAQASGSAIGLLVWLLAGPKLVRYMRGVWTSKRVGGTSGRLLLAYLVLLALAELLPLDLTLSPREVYQKFKDGKVTLRLFDEPATWAKVQSWLELAGLYLPAGLLAAGVPGVARRSSVVGLAFLLAGALEVGQLFVKSRTTSATDVLIGGTAATLGWLIGRQLPTRRGLSLEAGLLLAQAWLLLLVAVNWQPFAFDRALAGPRLERMNWIPFAATIDRNYLSSLEEAVAKTLLYAPLGAILVGVGPFVFRTRKPVYAAALGALAAAVIEGVQLFVPGRVPGPTDLVFGAVGGWLGATAAHRLRCVSPEARLIAVWQAPREDTNAPIRVVLDEEAYSR